MLNIGMRVLLLATAGLLLIEHSTAACTDGNSSTCNDQGTCASSTCTCTNGYGGTTCETAPACTNNDGCKNGGSCNTTASPYTCICATGFMGETCESGSVQVTFVIISLLVTTFLSVLLK
ncbi:delta-like protein B [Haliotis asinina]|uniref:delta-like protein B n=1 Tax=Haliotis asinina TaxID=109174 RepID=UPI0035318ABE